MKLWRNTVKNIQPPKLKVYETDWKVAFGNLAKEIMALEAYVDYNIHDPNIKSHFESAKEIIYKSYNPLVEILDEENREETS